MRGKYVLAGLTLGLLLVGWASQPPALALSGAVPELPDDLDSYLAARESAARREFGLIPGTESRIRWYDGPGSTTAISIVYLHGFSATRQEIAPVGEMIADRLGANLFEARLTAHGREHRALYDVRAEDWLNDAIEALAIGRRIGHRVVVIGTSTGATLALAVLRHPLMQSVDALVMLAPNLVLRDASSEIMTWPGGPLVARLVIGESRSWEPKNPLQARYWTTTYPTSTVVEVLRLMKFARQALPPTAPQRLLTIASPSDTVVDPGASWDWIRKIDAPQNEHRDFPYSKDPGQHVLAGDILSPASNERLASLVVGFLNR